VNGRFSIRSINMNHHGNVISDRKTIAIPYLIVTLNGSSPRCPHSIAGNHQLYSSGAL
jgi:hypothetical protein